MTHVRQQTSDEFTTPNFAAPLDVDALLKQLPQGATVRGLFFAQVTDCVNRNAGEAFAGVSHSLYQHYPMAEFIDHVVEAGKLCYPKEPLREQLRRMGTGVYPYFEQTMPGKAIFAFASNRFERVAKLAGKGYSVALSPGSCETFVTPGRAIAKLRDVWTFPTSLQVGIWEGAMQVCGTDGRVRVREYAPCDADLEITWAT